MENQSAQGDFFPFWSMNRDYDIMWNYTEPCGYILCTFQSRVRGQIQHSAPSAGSGLASCSRAVMHWHESFHPVSHMLKDILSIHSATLFTLSHSVPSSSATPYQLKQLELVTLFTNTAVFRRCRWGINLIILQFALAQLFLVERERPWLWSCLAACPCEVLPSVSTQIPPVQTGALTQMASFVKMFSPLHFPPCPSLCLFSALAFTSLSLSTSWLVHTLCFSPHTQTT